MSNSLKINPNGPFTIKGSLKITVADETEEKSSAYLCRCGASANKPYCDGAHKSCGFEDDGGCGNHKLTAGEATDEGDLEVSVRKNGPLVVTGPVTVTAGEETLNGERLVLCRCGESKNRPFCDGSHKAAGFEAN